ncbi:MAG TPA: 50S ribosomal protein L13 [Planctomycetia bacterium]|nr:50S ribosomal protein L13 [Planctomycetia bacterium]
MKTFVMKPAELKPEWLLVDATDLVVGRLAAKIAPMLIGKHKPTYTPHVACGDFIVVVNAEKVQFTGGKWQKKTYDRYTGYPSGRKVLTAEELKAKSPETIIMLAVRRMLPKNRLGSKILTQLKIYAGAEHPHQAQQPRKLDIQL